MINPNNYYLMVDNQKYFLSNNDYKNNQFYINPMQYNITSTSTIRMGRYFNTAANTNNINITANILYTDFPKYGSFPLKAFNIDGTINRSYEDYNWRIHLPNIILNENTVNTVLTDYTILYSIPLVDIVNEGIIKVIFTFALLENEILSYAIKESYDNTEEITNWTVLEGNLLEMETLKSQYYNSAIISTNDRTSYTEVNTNYFNLILYIKSNLSSNNFTDITIQNIDFEINYIYFTNPRNRSRYVSKLKNMAYSNGIYQSPSTNSTRLKVINRFNAPMIMLAYADISNITWYCVYFNTNRILLSTFSSKREKSSTNSFFYTDEFIVPINNNSSNIGWISAGENHLSMQGTDVIDFNA